MESKQLEYNVFVRRNWLRSIQICVASIITAVVATYLQTRNWPSYYYIESMKSAVAIPLFIAPIASYYVQWLMQRNYRLLMEVERHANYDDLTGLLNRRAFLRESNQQLLTTTRPAVLLGDIDWFKRINDTLGHAAGDAVLLHIAQVLTKTASDNCLVGRLGGEEFAVFFQWETLNDARKKAEEFRHAIEGTPCLFEGKSISITISFGLAIAQENNTIEGLLRRADTALYRAKDSGRNQTLLAA
jgi:diguanylate cyclase (GGDEF)-like protein